KDQAPNPLSLASKQDLASCQSPRTARPHAMVPDQDPRPTIHHPLNTRARSQTPSATSPSSTPRPSPDNTRDCNAPQRLTPPTPLSQLTQVTRRRTLGQARESRPDFPAHRRLKETSRSRHPHPQSHGAPTRENNQAHPLCSAPANDQATRD